MNNENLCRAIKESGLKKSFIAKQIGLSPQAFTNRLNGTSAWRANEAVDVCKVLGLSGKKRDAIFFG